MLCILFYSNICVQCTQDVPNKKKTQTFLDNRLAKKLNVI